MPSTITSLADRQPAATATAQLFENWFDPIETAVRDCVHGFIQAMIEAELDEALSRTRYARHTKACLGRDRRRQMAKPPLAMRPSAAIAMATVRDR